MPIIPPGRPPPGPRRAARGRRRAAAAGRRRRRSAAHAAASSRTAASRRSRGRSRWSRAARACVPMPTIRPASRTTIRSAFMIVPTRWATMITRRVAELLAEGGAQPGVGREVERREAVVEDEDAACLTSARAIASRWRWPPDTFVPPWVIGASSPSSIASTKSRPWAISSACQSSSSVASGVAEAQVAGDGAREQERLLRDEPDPAPQVLAAHLADVDAVDQHLAAGGVVEARDQVDQRRLAAAGAADDRGRLARSGAERDVRAGPAPRRPGSGTRRRGTRRRRAGGPDRSGVTGCSGSRIVGSVSRTSWIRPAETAARGIRMNMKTAVSTANRIWSRYCRNAVRPPIDSSPSSTRDGAEPDDGDRREVEDRPSSSGSSARTGGSRAAWCRTGRGSPRRSAASSCCVRTKARMTRTPASVSRMTWLIRSSFSCIDPEQRDGARHDQAR